MGYRKEDIPGMIAALKVAKADVGYNRNFFVCNALMDAYARGDISDRQYYDTKSMISDAIAPYWTFESWLLINHGVSEECYGRIAVKRNWIDKMIADLKEYAK